MEAELFSHCLAPPCLDPRQHAINKGHGNWLLLLAAIIFLRATLNLRYIIGPI